MQEGHIADGKMNGTLLQNPCQKSLSPFKSNAELFKGPSLIWNGEKWFQLCAFVVEEEKVNFYNNNQCVIMYNKQQHNNEKKYNVPTITYK